MSNEPEKGQRPTATENRGDQTDTHIGNRLREARLLAGLSQTKVAKRLGVTFQAVQKYERGEIRLSASRLWLCCGVLGLEPNYFFEGLAVGGERASPRLAPELSGQMLELFKVYESLPSDDIRLSFLRTMRVCGRQLSAPLPSQ